MPIPSESGLSNSSKRTLMRGCRSGESVPLRRDMRMVGNEVAMTAGNEDVKIIGNEIARMIINKVAIMFNNNEVVKETATAMMTRIHGRITVSVTTTRTRRRPAHGIGAAGTAGEPRVRFFL